VEDKRYYHLRFIKGGQDELLRITALADWKCLEVLRERLGMGWLLVSMEVEGE
jgi:hypothetical protein